MHVRASLSEGKDIEAVRVAAAQIESAIEIQPLYRSRLSDGFAFGKHFRTIDLKVINFN